MRILSTTPGERVVVHDAGRATRWLVKAVKLELDDAVRAHVLEGRPAPLPEPVERGLAGFALRAGMGPIEGVAEVVAAGVARVRLAGLPPLAAAFGNPYVSVRWIEGAPLELSRRPALAAPLRRAIEALHARGVCHGALERDRFVVAAGVPWLVDLARLHRGDPGEDLAAVDAIEAWLTDADPTLSLASDTVFVPDD